MRQVTMSGTGGPEVLQIQEVAQPTLKAGEILIEVFAAGVNRPDLAQREGKYPPPPGASSILGLEVSGIVREIALAGNTNFKVGDRVCALATGGGYADDCVVPASHALPIPGDFTFEEAAGLPETFFTVWANVFEIAHLKAGESFLVHGGASGIGTTAIQLARAFGARVFATAGSDAKCKACTQLGAEAINYKTQEFESEILRLTEGRGVDVILDMVAGDYVERNIKCLALDGRIATIAALRGAKVSFNIFSLMQKRGVLTGSTLRPRSHEEKARIADALRTRVWPLLARREIGVIIERVFPFEQVSEAHRHLEAGDHVGKVILKMK